MIGLRGSAATAGSGPPVEEEALGYSRITSNDGKGALGQLAALREAIELSQARESAARVGPPISVAGQEHACVA
ncbi:hypothetical protein BRAO285_1230044 [Bradyrhizobium sp. ORS 285]|nr:hypothetical protein BRAO285_1230044 [Bradyrhizobium sp. ORS 285]